MVLLLHPVVALTDSRAQGPEKKAMKFLEILLILFLHFSCFKVELNTCLNLEGGTVITAAVLVYTDNIKGVLGPTLKIWDTAG